jgi:hypothetical protein
MPDILRQTEAIFPDRIRLPFEFDAVRLHEDLDRLAHYPWIDHLVRQNYEGDWSVIPLRMAAGATHPVMMIYADPGATRFEDAPPLDHAPYLRQVLARFRCPLQTARLMRLTPGSIIREHRDHDLAAEWGMARIHVPITTNADVDFRLNGRRVAMAPGEAWYLRLSDPHSVANRGTTDRVHLVIDCVVDAWLTDQLRSSPDQTRQPSSVSPGSSG